MKQKLSKEVGLTKREMLKRKNAVSIIKQQKKRARLASDSLELNSILWKKKEYQHE